MCNKDFVKYVLTKVANNYNKQEFEVFIYVYIDKLLIVH